MREAWVTVLFADIAGFSKHAERLPADDIARLLNGYFEIVTSAIFGHQGTVNKFIGDCVMAVFGAPIQRDNDEELAIRAAIQIQARRIQRLKEKLSRMMAAYCGQDYSKVLDDCERDNWLDAEAALAPGVKSRLALLLKDMVNRAAGTTETDIVDIFRNANQKLVEQPLINSVKSSLQATTKSIAGTDYAPSAIRASGVELDRVGSHPPPSK